MSGVSHNKFQSAAVLMGGVSHEREISLKSGRAVANALKRVGVCVDEHDVGADLLDCLQRIRSEAVFLALHGTGGEDGSIQEILESRKIPYTGSGPQGSRSAFFKDLSKKFFVQAGIPTPEYTLFNRTEPITEINFSGPWVIKPVAEGSSIGVSMAENETDLRERIEILLAEYENVLVEKRICGRELTVGILAETALPVIELKTTRSFYDFKAKYTPGFTEYLVPAPLTEKMSRKAQQISLTVHNVLGLADFSRVDVMLDESDRFYVLEANSIPGFTDSSLLPKAARFAGIDFDKLCLRILNSASLKHETAALAQNR